jgi:hypothetical protein
MTEGTVHCMRPRAERRRLWLGTSRAGVEGTAQCVLEDNALPSKCGQPVTAHFEAAIPNSGRRAS